MTARRGGQALLRDPRKMTEAELLQRIVHLAKLTDWWLHHDRPAPTVDGRKYLTHTEGFPGFPDLVLARCGIVLFRELKGYDSRGRLGQATPDQLEWGDRLDPSRAMVRVAPGLNVPLFRIWTPSDWPAIERILKAPRPW